MLSVMHVPREVQRLCSAVVYDDDEKMVALSELVVEGPLSYVGVLSGASQESCGYRRRVALRRTVGGRCMTIAMLTVGDKIVVRGVRCGLSVCRGSWSSFARAPGSCRIKTMCSRLYSSLVLVSTEACFFVTQRLVSSLC